MARPRLVLLSPRGSSFLVGWVAWGEVRRQPDFSPNISTPSCVIKENGTRIFMSALDIEHSFLFPLSNGLEKRIVVRPWYVPVIVRD